ncbi:MAG: arginase family protein [Anaerovoracaceae bacterium]|jgi:arginase
MKENKLNIVIPQWQGGGQDLCTWYGAYALKENYLKDDGAVVVDIGTEDIGPVKNDILAYDDIMEDIGKVNEVLKENNPDKIFTLGGGCDADTPCAAWLNKKLNGDMAVVYIDSHGDLNTPKASDSKLYYGMSLRALTGESDPWIIGQLASTVSPNQLILCANRNLDPEELDFKKQNGVSDFPVETIESDPSVVAAEIARKGFNNVYIHIDLDSTDPEEFTLTPVPEPNGLKCDTLVTLIEEIRKSGVRIAGFGILEYCGTKEDKGNDLITRLVDFGKNI